MWFPSGGKLACVSVSGATLLLVLELFFPLCMTDNLFLSGTMLIRAYTSYSYGSFELFFIRDISSAGCF